MLYRYYKMKDLKFGILNETYGSQLSARQREIISNYYDFDLSLAEIADNYGVTRQAVADALKKGQKALEQLESEMGFCGKMAQIKEGIETLCEQFGDDMPEAAKNAAADILNLI